MITILYWSVCDRGSMAVLTVKNGIYGKIACGLYISLYLRGALHLSTWTSDMNYNCHCWMSVRMYPDLREMVLTEPGDQYFCPRHARGITSTSGVSAMYESESLRPPTQLHPTFMSGQTRIPLLTLIHKSTIERFQERRGDTYLSTSVLSSYPSGSRRSLR